MDSSKAEPPPPTRIGSLGFFHHARQRRHDFFHLFVMAGVLLLSVKAAGQSYHIKELQEGKKSLLDENESLKDNLSSLKQTLLQEVSRANSPSLVLRLKALLNDPAS
eukprot:TRINITY_DN11193_c0_g1_i1.p1 TRINITY_DN11193_c0_g1~~TRINITY_DN11193_c0_g1_i1.p1  ORF type:complete len:107 (-),score=23.81 TRINITY_DN11193_c0_g1_i1:260-580(-)